MGVEGDETESTRVSSAAHRDASAGGSAASGKMDRPARTYVTGKWTRGLRIGALGVAGISAASILIGYAFLPETIPTHLDFAGRPDGWGHKSSVLVILGILGATIAGSIWLSHHPRVFNYPVPITEFNAQAVYRVGEQTMVWVSLGCALLLAGASTSMVMAMNANGFVVAGLVCLAGGVIVGIGRMIGAAHRVSA